MVVGVLAMASATMVRSMVSKIVDPSEIGKIFSLVSSVDSAVPLVVSPALTAIYNATIDTFPGAFFTLISAIFLVTAANFVVVGILFKRNLGGENYSSLREEHRDHED